MAKNILKDVDYPLEPSKKLKAALEPGDKTGHVAVMSPEEFLHHANRLKGTREDKLLISAFKNGMKKGKKFKALKLLAHNHADGRHRATAAEELGIKKIPVIDYRHSGLKAMKGVHKVGKKPGKIKDELRKEKAYGGALSSRDPNRFMEDVLKFSFQVLPLLRPGYLKEVPKQGFADGGEVEGDVQFAPPDVEQALLATKPEEKKYEPFSVLPLREDKEGVHFDPYAGLLGTVTRPFKYFTETMSGEKPMEPTSEEAIKAATELAGLMTLGSGAFERPAGSIASGLSRPMTHDDARLLSMKALLPEGHPLSPKSDELLDLYKTLMEEKIHGDIWLPNMRVAAKKFHKLKREADVTPEHYTEQFLQKYLTDPVVKEGTIPTWSEDKTPSTINNIIINALRDRSANDLDLQNQMIAHELPHIEEFDPVIESAHRARALLNSGARNFTGPNMDSLVDKVLSKAPEGFIPQSQEPWSIFSSNVESFKKPFMNRWAQVGGTLAHRRAYSALQDFGPNQGMDFWMGEKPLTQSERIPSQNLRNSLAKLYQETQEYLRDSPKKTVRLYRGIGGHPDEYHPAPVESWTSKRDVAERFGRTMKKDGKYSILTADVPLESVLMNWKSAEGYWPPEEALKGKEEWTLLGGGLRNGMDVKWK